MKWGLLFIVDQELHRRLTGPHDFVSYAYVAVSLGRLDWLKFTDTDKPLAPGQGLLRPINKV